MFWVVIEFVNEFTINSGRLGHLAIAVFFLIMWVKHMWRGGGDVLKVEESEM